MGFLSFGKKDKMPAMGDSLDIPPPPPFDIGKSGMPAASPMPTDLSANMGFSKDSMKLPPEQSLSPGLDIPPIGQNDLPPLPGMPENDIFKQPQMKAPMMEKPKRSEPARKEMPQYNPQSSVRSDDGKPLFIEVNEYRQIVKEINGVKDALKLADDEIGSLMSDLSAEDKAFASIHSTLSDIQERLSHLEHSVFR